MDGKDIAKMMWEGIIMFFSMTMPIDVPGLGELKLELWKWLSIITAGAAFFVMVFGYLKKR